VIAASTTTSGQARFAMAAAAPLYQQPSHGQPDGNTVTGPDLGPDQYREGYRQLLAPVPSGIRNVEKLRRWRLAVAVLPDGSRHVRVVAVDT